MGWEWGRNWNSQMGIPWKWESVTKIGMGMGRNGKIINGNGWEWERIKQLLLISDQHQQQRCKSLCSPVAVQLASKLLSCPLLLRCLRRMTLLIVSIVTYLLYCNGLNRIINRTTTDIIQVDIIRIGVQFASNSFCWFIKQVSIINIQHEQ